MAAAESIQITLIGDSGSGKTSLIQQYVNNVFNAEMQPTIGHDLEIKKTIVDDKPVSIKFWDTAGQERFRSLPNNYYRGTHCCVLIFDVTSMTSYQHLHEWRDEFINRASPPEPDKFPFVLIGNKIDLQDRQVDTAIAEKWSQLRSIVPYFECSAKDNLNLDPAFQTAAMLALQQKKREVMSKNAIVKGKLVKQIELSSPSEETSLSGGHTGSAQEKCGADAFYEDGDRPESLASEQNDANQAENDSGNQGIARSLIITLVQIKENPSTIFRCC